ncbi:hypothetical protein P4475_06055 [Halalkalibacterium halodurans]|nr:hypothetical protein [Halalkalibacterium halodurans]
MTVSEKKQLDDKERMIERLKVEIKELKQSKKEGFDSLETDHFLTEAYN